MMAGKNTAVFGIYPSRLEMEEAADRLRRAGFRGTDISALLQDNQGTKDFAHEKNTKAPEGFSAGVIVGAILGGVLGWLVGSGALVIPRLVGFTAAGPMVGALAGAGALGILCGILGALIGMGVPEYEARRYEGRIRHGGVLVSVHCDNRDWVKRAKEVMVHAGGQKIGAEVEKSGDFGNVDKPLPRARATSVPLPEDDVYAERTTPRTEEYVERTTRRIDREQDELR
jgi:F0F1-type ATP synthase assembly protein I